MKNTLVILFIVFLSGCSNDPNNLNGKYVKDADGKIYHAKAKIGDMYFLTEIDIDNVKSLLNFAEIKSEE